MISKRGWVSKRLDPPIRVFGDPASDNSGFPRDQLSGRELGHFPTAAETALPHPERSKTSRTSRDEEMSHDEPLLRFGGCRFRLQEKPIGEKKRDSHIRFVLLRVKFMTNCFHACLLVRCFVFCFVWFGFWFARLFVRSFVHSFVGFILFCLFVGLFLCLLVFILILSIIAFENCSVKLPSVKEISCS